MNEASSFVVCVNKPDKARNLGEMLFETLRDAVLADNVNPDAKLTANIKLSEYLLQYKKILYCYDYGDDWRHYIEIDKVIEGCTDELPLLLSGEGDAPPEDVGGAGGFAEFIRIINDPDDKDYEFNSNRAKRQFWKPFDFETVKGAVKRSLDF
jgi:hypothetical protein